MKILFSKVGVCTVDGKLVHSIQAVGIPQISNEVEEVDTTVLASIFGLAANESEGRLAR